MAHLDSMRIMVARQEKSQQSVQFDPSDKLSPSGFVDGALAKLKSVWLDRQGFGHFLSFYTQKMNPPKDKGKSQPAMLTLFEVERLFKSLLPNQRGRVCIYRLIDFLGLVGHSKPTYDLLRVCETPSALLDTLRSKYLHDNRCGASNAMVRVMAMIAMIALMI